MQTIEIPKLRMMQPFSLFYVVKYICNKGKKKCLGFPQGIFARYLQDYCFTVPVVSEATFVVSATVVLSVTTVSVVAVSVVAVSVVV